MRFGSLGFFFVNVSTTIGWIVMKCGSDIHGSLKINLNVFFGLSDVLVSDLSNDGGDYRD